MTGYRPPYRAGAFVGAGIFALYVLTLAPTTAWWDASEYITTGHLLGIPHPPGNPLFVSVARTWSLLLAPLGLPVAVRINLLAAFTSATATFFFFLIGHRILSAVLEERWMAIVGAASGALMGATAYTVWNQSNANEKVYTVSVAIVAAASWLLLRWYDQQDEPAGLRALLGALYAMVLGAANHLMSVIPLPAFGLFVLLAGPAVLLRKGFWIRAVPLVVLGLSFNVFLPIRAAQDPIINEGDPTCASAGGVAVAIYTNGKAGCPALASSLSREQYAKPPLGERQAPFRDQLLNYFQYFDWQWARGADLGSLPMGARLPATVLFMAMGFMGFLVVWRADRYIFAYMVTLTATVTLGLVVYLNFEYGFSLAPHVTDRLAHEVRERDYFFVASFILWGNLAGLGLAGFWSALSDHWGGGAAYRWAAPIFIVALIPLAYNWAWASRAGDYAPRDWAYDLLMSVEPYGILFTNGDNDTFPLWYLQEIEGIRKDVSVIVLQYLYTDWYPKQLRDMTEPERQRAFSEEFAVGLYPATPIPDSAITGASDEILDAVGSGRIPDDLEPTARRRGGNVSGGDVPGPRPSPGSELHPRLHRTASRLLRELRWPAGRPRPAGLGDPSRPHDEAGDAELERGAPGGVGAGKRSNGWPVVRPRPESHPGARRLSVPRDPGPGHLAGSQHVEHPAPLSVPVRSACRRRGHRRSGHGGGERPGRRGRRFPHDGPGRPPLPVL